MPSPLSRRTVLALLLVSTAALADSPKRPAGRRTTPDPFAELPGHWHTQISAARAPQLDLGVRWETAEGVWRGTWIRRGKTNKLDGSWVWSNVDAFKGTLEVLEDDTTIIVKRTDHSGNTCVYRASKDSIPSQWHGTSATVFNGTVSCTNTGHQMIYPWSARIVKQ